MILSRYSWTIYVALWFFVISRKLWGRESLLQKRNKYNLLIFCFLFLKIRLIVLLELKAFSCDFGIGTFVLCCCCSITKLSDSLWPMDYCTPGFPLLHFLQEFAQTHFHDTIQPSYPLLPPSLPALSLSQHRGLFQWVRSSLII